MAVKRKSHFKGVTTVFDLKRAFLDLDQPRRAAFRVAGGDPMLKQTSKLRSMMPQDDEPTSKPEPPSKPSRTEEARRIIEEYANDLREIRKKFRKLFN
jgi:hypothetical protein